MGDEKSRNPLAMRRLVPFLSGYALGNSGDMFTQVAVLWTGYSLSGKAISLAGLGAAWIWASAVMSLVSGPLVDRWNRRNALIGLHGCLALLSLTLFALAQANQLAMWHLWAYLAVSSAFGVPCEMAFESLLPDLVRGDGLVRVNGLLQSWGMTDNLVEAAVAGIVIAQWGPAPVFLFNGAMYLLGSAGALFVPGWAAEHTPRSGGWHPLCDLRLTARYVLREPLLRRTVLLGVVGSMLFGCLFFMPPLVAESLGSGSEGYGFLQSLTLGGVLVGSLLASSVGVRWPKAGLWIGGHVLYGLAFLALGVFLHWGYAMASLAAYVVFFLFGLGCTGERVYYATLVQQMLPSAHRGRVFGISGFAGRASQPLALATAMAFVDRVGVGPVLAVLAGLTVLLAASRTVLLPMHDRNWVLSAPPQADGPTESA